MNGEQIGALTIGGSVIGNARGTNGLGQIVADGTIGAIKIGRNVLGDQEVGSGKIEGRLGILSVTIGGDLIGGTGQDSGFVSSSVGPIGSVKMGGSLIGSSSNHSGEALAIGKLGSVSVGGDLLSGARIASNQSINSVKIGGSMVGSDILVLGADAVSRLGIKSVTIGGRVENGGIQSTSADAQIGSIKVGGDWNTSNLTTGIVAGADMFFGTADDAVSTVANDPALFSKIASITIGGQVRGTDVGTDRFGFVSQEIGSLKIHGVSVPLTKGRGNDIDMNNTRFILGATRNVTVHEVA